MTQLRIPIWVVLVPLALLTTFLFLRDRRARRKSGCCKECGYNLTGNVSGRCPEFGATL
jgi:hypothetical protein